VEILVLDYEHHHTIDYLLSLMN